LDAEELRRHLVELQNPARALVFLTAATGSRLSEALGLKWSDVEIGSGAINLSHVVVRQACWRNKDGSISEAGSDAWRTGYYPPRMELKQAPLPVNLQSEREPRMGQSPQRAPTEHGSQHPKSQRSNRLSRKVDNLRIARSG